MKSILSIDIGTTNIKAILFDLSGASLHVDSEKVTTLHPENGFSEQDPLEVLNAFNKLLERTTSKYESSQTLALSLSSGMHSLMAVDKNCKPLSNAMLWSDLRATDIAMSLKASPLGKSIYNQTGTPIHPMTPICKIIWLQENQTDIFNRTFKFISLKEFITFHLTRKFIIDKSMANATGLFNNTSLDWHAPSLVVAKIASSNLSKLCASTEIFNIVSGAFSNKKLVIGGSDGCLANLGSGIFKSSSLSLTIGTSAAIRKMLKTPAIDPNHRTFCYYLDEEYYVQGGASNNGGNVYEWLINQYSEVDINQIGNVPIGANGITVLPYVFDERAPFYDTGRKVVISGKKDHHTSNDVIRAFIEGLSFNLYLISESLGEFDDIIASGGFVESEWWIQMLADIFNRKIMLLQTGENSALGAAIIAMKALGLIKNYSETLSMFKTGKVYESDPLRHDAYMNSYAKFKALTIAPLVE
ncbi:MAG: gluconokinase [Bacteroidetes bacterium]|nr:gluconokinase [Bacteroidota bacterium]MDA1121632.1 gluconokinase [Bacteroidota bacterium]